MSKKTVQLPKETTRQLGCRANKSEEILITRAAVLSRRDRNSFIVVAALEAARTILRDHGLEENDVLETGSKTRKLA